MRCNERESRPMKIITRNKFSKLSINVYLHPFDATCTAYYDDDDNHDDDVDDKMKNKTRFCKNSI